MAAMIGRRALVAGFVAMAALSGLGMPIAAAEEPFDLDGQLVDRVGVLGDREAEVQTAIDRLAAEEGVRLYVVYVDGFSGWDGTEWADETASRNGLAATDALLAVATDERVYALSIDPESPLTGHEADEIETVAIEPALRASDWAGAAVAAADALGDVRDGQTVRPPTIEASAPAGDSSNSGVTLWVVVAVVVAVLAVAALAWALFSRTRAVRPPPE